MLLKILCLISLLIPFSYAQEERVNINEQFNKDLNSESSKKGSVQMQQEVDEKKAADERFKRSGMKDREAFDRIDKIEMEKNKLK